MKKSFRDLQRRLIMIFREQDFYSPALSFNDLINFKVMLFISVCKIQT